MRENRKKKVLIIGCSNMGARIAVHLCHIGNNVTIIDINKESFKKLSHTFSGFLFEGDGSNLEILEQAGVKLCDIVLVSTDDDNINSLIAQMCKTILKVKKVIVRMDFTDTDKILKEQGIDIIHPSELSLHAYLEIENLKEADES